MLTFRRHIESVNAVRWSPQGSHLASAGNDNLVYVWEATTGKPITVYEGHHAWITQGLAWSPDGTLIASASWDHTVQVWDAFSCQTLLTYRGHKGVVCSLDWSPGGKYLASGSGFPECQVHVWDAETGALVLAYREHERDEKQERTFSKGLPPEAREQLRSASSIHFLNWSPNGQWIASADPRWLFRVWEATIGQNVLSRNECSGPIAWSPDSRFVITIAGYQANSVAQWSVAADRPLFVYETKIPASIEALSWSPNGQWIAGSSHFSEIKVWKAVTPADASISEQQA